MKTSLDLTLAIAYYLAKARVETLFFAKGFNAEMSGNLARLYARSIEHQMLAEILPMLSPFMIHEFNISNKEPLPPRPLEWDGEDHRQLFERFKDIIAGVDLLLAEIPEEVLESALEFEIPMDVSPVEPIQATPKLRGF